MKTIETQQMEQALYAYCLEAQGIVVEEVTMPADQGIVDTLACFTKSDGSTEWRCYELKYQKQIFAHKQNYHLSVIITIWCCRKNYMKK